MWFDNWPEIGQIALTTLVVYFALIAILQIAGKRSIAKLNIFDLVVTVALGSILASVMLTRSLSVRRRTGGLYRACRPAVDGQLRLGAIRDGSSRSSGLTRGSLLKDGEFFEDEMKTERVTARRDRGRHPRQGSWRDREYRRRRAGDRWQFQRHRRPACQPVQRARPDAERRRQIRKRRSLVRL